MPSLFDIERKEVPRVVSRFFAIVGMRDIRRCCSNVSGQLKRAPVLGEFLQEQREIEIELARVAEYRRNTGRIPKPSRDRKTYSALAFACTFVRVHDQLSEEGRSKLVGRFRGALKGDGSLRGIYHELSVAGHLSQSGWSVRFTDLEGTERFDFLATKNRREVEIECKSISADQGRKIHRKEFRRLAVLVHSELQQILRSNNGIRLVRLEIQDRLPTSDAKLKKIARSLIEMIRTGREVLSEDEYKLCLEFHNFNENQDYIDKKVAEFLRKTVQYPNSNHNFIVGVQHGICLISATSSRPDQVLTYIYKQLKRAHSQLSKNRAAVIWVNVEDISPDQWATLREGSGLQIMSSRYLAGPERQHICSLAFNSSGEVTTERTHTSEAGPLLHFDNSSSPFYDPVIREMYGHARTNCRLNVDNRLSQQVSTDSSLENGPPLSLFGLASRQARNWVRRRVWPLQLGQFPSLI